MVSAYGYTLLTGKAAQIVIGAMLMLTVPLRYAVAPPRDWRSATAGLRSARWATARWWAARSAPASSCCRMLMAAGLQGAAVIATDAVISIVVGIVRLSVFGLLGRDHRTGRRVRLLIGVVALPGAFLAKALVERMPVHVHTAILDAVVLVGGVVMVVGALSRD